MLVARRFTQNAWDISSDHQRREEQLYIGVMIQLFLDSQLNPDLDLEYKFKDPTGCFSNQPVIQFNLITQHYIQFF